MDPGFGSAFYVSGPGSASNESDKNEQNHQNHRGKRREEREDDGGREGRKGRKTGAENGVVPRAPEKEDLNARELLRCADSAGPVSPTCFDV
jgi:hypothetical protein